MDECCVPHQQLILAPHLRNRSRDFVSVESSREPPPPLPEALMDPTHDLRREQRQCLTVLQPPHDPAHLATKPALLSQDRAVAVTLMGHCSEMLASTFVDVATIAQPCQQSHSGGSPNLEWEALSADALLSVLRQPQQQVAQRNVAHPHNGQTNRPVCGRWTPVHCANGAPHGCKPQHTLSAPAPFVGSRQCARGWMWRRPLH